MWNEIWNYLEGLYSTNQFLQGGIIIGFITSVGMYLQSQVPKLWERIKRYSKFYVIVEEHESRRLYHFIETWLRENHVKQYRNLKAKLYDKEYDELNAPMPSANRLENDEYTDAERYEEDYRNNSNSASNNHSTLKFEQIDDYFYVYYKGRYIRVSQNRDKLEHASDFHKMYVEKYTFSCWFGKKHISNLLSDIVLWGENIESSKPKKTTTTIFNSDSDGNTDYLTDIDVKDFDKIIIDKKNELIDDIDAFISNESWYKTRSIPYKRGYLFEGLAGNGKTTLSLSIAQSYGRDIIVANLSNMTNKGLEWLFIHSLTSNSILLLEDIDAMVAKERDSEKDDTSKEPQETVSLSTLLNCLDGVFSKHGAIVIMTTNHPKKLDPALIRHGRVDFTFKITNPNLNCIEEYLSLFFEDKIILKRDESKEYVNNLSMVKVQNVCIDNKDSLVDSKKIIEGLLSFK